MRLGTATFSKAPGIGLSAEQLAQDLAALAQGSAAGAQQAPDPVYLALAQKLIASQPAGAGAGVGASAPSITGDPSLTDTVRSGLQQAWLGDPAAGSNPARALAGLSDSQLQSFLAGLSPEELLALVSLLSSGGTGSGGWGNGAPGNWPSQRGQVQQQIGRRVRGTDRPDRSYDTSNITLPQGQVGKLLKAISGQESGGKYGAVNPHSGALGKYQVMPANVKQWSKDAGVPCTPQQFLASPELQEKIVGHRMEKYFKEGMAATGSEEGAVRYAASKWYSGRGEKWNDNRPQSYNGHSYPSIAHYTASVYQRYQRAG